MSSIFKHILFAVQLFILTGVCSVPSLSYAQDITSNLIGHWTFEDTDGDTTTDDTTGNGFNGTLTNMDPSTDFVQGVFGQGISFDGSNDGVSIPDLGVNSNTMTFSGWIRGNSFANTPGFIFDRDPPGSFAEGLWADPAGNLRYTWSNDFPGSTLTMNTGEWTFIAMTVSPAQLIVYKGTRGAGLQSQTYNTGYAAQTLNDLWIGEDPTSSRFFNGLMDDVRIYDRTLTPADIQALFEAPIKSCELQNRGSITYNNSKNVMQYCDGTNWVAMGKTHYVPTAVNFDGTNDDLYLGSPLTGPTDGSRVTGSFWARRDVSQSGSLQVILQGENSNTLVQWEVTDRFFTKYKNAEGDDVLGIRSNAVLNDFDWHHVMWSADMNVPGSPRMYVDGIDVTNTAIFGDLNAANGINNVLDFTLTDYRIGANIGGSAAYFNGDIADLWVDFGTYIDLSDADNRLKFLSASGNPVDLGESGEGPTGSPPDIFLSNDVETWHINNGSGGGFTENGTLEQALYAPGDVFWSQTGNSLSVTGTTSPGMTLLNSTTIALSHGAIDQLRTYSWDGSDWIQVGNSLGGAGGGELAALDSNTIARSVGTSSDLRTFSWDGNDWTQIGNAALTPGSSSSSIEALDGNTIVYINSSDDNLRTYTWDGSDWTQIGNAYPYNVFNPSITRLNANTIAVCHGDISTFTWDGTDWSQVGSTFTVPSAAQAHCAALDSRRIAHIDSTTDMLSIYTWNGNSWSKTGSSLYISGIGPSDIAALNSNTIALFDAGSNDFLATYQSPSCSNPTSPIGSINYNATTNQMQFCNGIAHVAMGPPGNGGGGCTNPTGSAGDLTFNTTLNMMQYCEGDEWVGISGAGDCRDIGELCSNGSVYAGLSPDGNTRMYTQPADNGLLPWGTSSIVTFVTTGITNTTTGEANTIALIALDSDAGTPGTQQHEAAQFCSDFTGHGNSDWYLPAEDELDILYNNRNAGVLAGTFTETASPAAYYWASTEQAQDRARHTFFFSGGTNQGVKDQSRNFRCVRKD